MERESGNLAKSIQQRLDDSLGVENLSPQTTRLSPTVSAIGLSASHDRASSISAANQPMAIAPLELKFVRNGAVVWYKLSGTTESRASLSVWIVWVV